MVPLRMMRSGAVIASPADTLRRSIRTLNHERRLKGGPTTFWLADAANAGRVRGGGGRIDSCRTLIHADAKHLAMAADTSSTRGSTRESALAPQGAHSNDIRDTVHIVAMP